MKLLSQLTNAFPLWVLLASVASLFFLATAVPALSVASGEEQHIRNEYYDTGEVYAAFLPEPDGTYLRKQFRKDQTLANEQYFDQNGLKEERLYDEQGRLAQEEVQADDARTQKTITRYYADGQTKAIWNYDRGRLTGTSQVFFPDGKLRETFEAENGALRVVTVYDPEGQVTFRKSVDEMKAEQDEFRSRRKSGTLRRYTPNGRHIEEVYTEGQLIDQNVFYESGALFAVRKYRSGVREGLVRWFYEDGKPSFEKEYVSGKPVWLKCYRPSGSLRYEETFEAGNRVRKVEYDETGKVQQTFAVTETEFIPVPAS